MKRNFLLLQVFLGENGVHDIEGNQLPSLVYVSREKRPGFEHHKKAGAMNSLVRNIKSASLLLFWFCFPTFPENKHIAND